MVSFTFSISISRRPSTSSPTSHPTSHLQPDFTTSHLQSGSTITPFYNNPFSSSPSPLKSSPTTYITSREESIYPLLSDEEEPEFKTEGAGSKKRVCVIQLSNNERAVKRHRRISSGNSGKVSADMDDRQYIVMGSGEKEMRKSYGIGGAGNIRTCFCFPFILHLFARILFPSSFLLFGSLPLSLHFLLSELSWLWLGEMGLGGEKSVRGIRADK